MLSVPLRLKFVRSSYISRKPWFVRYIEVGRSSEGPLLKVSPVELVTSVRCTNWKTCLQLLLEDRHYDILPLSDDIVIAEPA